MRLIVKILLALNMRGLQVGWVSEWNRRLAQAPNDLGSTWQFGGTEGRSIALARQASLTRCSRSCAVSVLPAPLSSRTAMNTFHGFRNRVLPGWENICHPTATNTYFIIFSFSTTHEIILCHWFYSPFTINVYRFTQIKNDKENKTNLYKITYIPIIT